MVMLIIAGTILGLLLWILFSPLVIYINSYDEKYQVSIKGVFFLRFLPAGHGEFRGRFLFVPFRFGVTTFGEKKEKEKGKEKKRKRPSIWSATGNIRHYIKSIRQIINSFYIKKLYLQVDTGDVILNAYLYPLALTLKTERFDVNVNFDDELGVILVIRNRIWNFVRIGAGFLFRKFFNK